MAGVVVGQLHHVALTGAGNPLSRADEVLPTLQRLYVDAGLLEQVAPVRQHHRMHIVRQTKDPTPVGVWGQTSLDDPVVHPRSAQKRNQVDKPHLLHRTAEEAAGPADLHLDQVGHVQVGPKRSAQPTGHRLPVHQLHVQPDARMLRLEGRSGFLIRNSVVAGKGPQAQGSRILLYGIEGQKDTSEQSDDQYENGRLAKREVIFDWPIDHRTVLCDKKPELD